MWPKTCDFFKRRNSMDFFKGVKKVTGVMIALSIFLNGCARQAPKIVSPQNGETIVLSERRSFMVLLQDNDYWDTKIYIPELVSFRDELICTGGTNSALVCTYNPSAYYQNQNWYQPQSLYYCLETKPCVLTITAFRGNLASSPVYINIIHHRDNQPYY